MVDRMTQCLWCRDGKHEPGAHHAADCYFYRSPFVGPDKAYWDGRLRHFLSAQSVEAEINTILFWDKIQRGKI